MPVRDQPGGLDAVHAQASGCPSRRRRGRVPPSVVPLPRRLPASPTTSMSEVSVITIAGRRGPGAGRRRVRRGWSSGSAFTLPQSCRQRRRTDPEAAPGTGRGRELAVQQADPLAHADQAIPGVRARAGAVAAVRRPRRRARPPGSRRAPGRSRPPACRTTLVTASWTIRNAARSMSGGSGRCLPCQRTSTRTPAAVAVSASRSTSASPTAGCRDGCASPWLWPVPS